ncbi:MAG: dihydropteroate synthase [Ilumatobacteraceae bacterium]|nr:dihydropteroate synthase [Ilumatobacteraceae bacterium]
MPELVTRGRALQVDHPLIMAVINATPDSFSDAGEYATLEARMQRASNVIAAGADILDVGGQSAITGVPEISESEEIDRIAPVIEWIAANTSVLISVDTYRPLVAKAALESGAHIINDISGLLYEELAGVVASHGAGYVLMHNRGRPKVRLTDSNLYENVVEDVMTFLQNKLVVLASHGVSATNVILDPGPDFSKTPSQTVDVLRSLGQITALGRPVLLPVSRKDFIGAITGKPPRQRLSGTLAAIAHSLTITRSGIYRVHDISEVRDFLNVWDVLNSHSQIDADALLDPSLWRS